MNTYPTIRACALILLTGAVLQTVTPDGAVTAGKGQIIDWRTVRSGETVRVDGDAFDTAQLFVAMVGVEAAERAADPLSEPPPPEVTTFQADEHGFRVRQFTVGGVRVRVEGLSWLGGTDTEAEAFTERLAALAFEVLS